MRTDGSKPTTLAPETSTPLFDVGDHSAPKERHLKPSYKFDAKNVVTLLVGPEKHSMIVHSNYLARTSEFFASALKKEWAEGQTRTIGLDEETPELIAHYLDWMYTTGLPTKECWPWDPQGSKTAANDLLAELYVLGERRLDSQLRNAIIAEFIRHREPLHDVARCSSFQRAGAINIIYQGTPPGSAARRLMVDLSFRSGCPRCYTADELDKAFLVDLTQIFFAAIHEPKSIEKQRLPVPRAEDYQV